MAKWVNLQMTLYEAKGRLVEENDCQLYGGESENGSHLGGPGLDAEEWARSGSYQLMD